MKNKNKIIVIIIIAVILVCLGIVAYKFYSKNETIKSFKEYISTYEKDFKNYNLNSQEKNKYNELMTKSDVAINLKSKDYIESLKSELSNFKNNIEKENIKDINSEYSRMKDMDISKLDNNTREKIKELKKEVENKINNKNFIEAKKDMDKINYIISKAKDNNSKKEDEKRELKKKAVGKNNQNNISGTYTYKELNKYGVPIVWDEIKIKKIGENKISFIGGYNFLLHAFYNGKDVNAKDITKEISKAGGTNSRSGTRGGVFEYKGNNIWEGKVCDDNNALTDDIGTPSDPKIPGKLSVNGDKLILTFEDKVVPYSKN